MIYVFIYFINSSTSYRHEISWETVYVDQIWHILSYEYDGW